MKKRLIGTLLLGALFVSSTSVFVSCKDYDDDINSVSSRVTVLEAAKVDLERKISDLRAEMAQIYATKAELADTALKERQRAIAQEIALGQRITTAQNAVDHLNALIGVKSGDDGSLTGDLAGLTYKEALLKTWAEIKTVDTNLGNRLTTLETDLNLDNPNSALRVYLKNLEDQIAVLNAYHANFTEGDLAATYAQAVALAQAAENNAKTYAEQQATEKANAAEANAKAYALQQAQEKAAAALADAKTYADGKLTEAKNYTDSQIEALDIPGLRQNLQTLSNKVDDLEAALNVLTMVERQLRGLVFRPKGYIDGVEAVKMISLEYWRFHSFTGENWFDLGGQNTGWNKKETKYNETDATFKIADTNKDRNSHDRYLRETVNNNVRSLTRTLDFTADYHLNPSCANISTITKDDVSTVSEDKWFDVTRANDAACGFFVKGITKPGDDGSEAGILKVHYGVTDPTKIAAGDKITVFATQVKYKGTGAASDTTITSDYATLKNEYVNHLVLSHAPKDVAKSLRVIKDGVNDGAVRVRNTHCGQCLLETSTSTAAAPVYDATRTNMHLFATITEAAGFGADDKTDNANNFAPQDSVAYNDQTGVDLLSLVETHYDDQGTHKHKILSDVADYGLEYRFELTYLKYGTNLTSESAHAVIVEKEGKPYLIPWMPTNETRNGVQSAYDPAKADQYQTKQLVGRTPLVRVSLVETSTGDVLDYGYIRFLITDVKDPDPTPSDYRRFISYTGDAWSVDVPWTYTQNCGGATWPGTAFSFTTTWIETELDLYALAGVSKKDFDENWKPDVKTAGGSIMKQYRVGAVNPNNPKERLFVAAVADTGTVTRMPNAEDSESEVLNWVVSANDMRDLVYKAAGSTTRPSALSIAVRYIYDPDGNGVSNNEAKDIYVVFNTGALTVNEAAAITGAVNWANRKNANYWYARNSWEERSGLVEVHANTWTPEDGKKETGKANSVAQPLEQTIQAAFVGNKIVDLTSATDKAAFITFQNAPANFWVDLALEFTLKDKDGNALTKSFKGVYEGKVENFVLKIADGAAGTNKLLKAFWDKNNDQTQQNDEPEMEIAELVYNTNVAADKDINHMSVVYKHTGFAEALLNYKGRKELADDVLTAYVTVTAKYGTCPIPLSCEPIQVRFIRPINVTSNDAEMQDAATANKQIVYLRDLVNLTDWRLVLGTNDYNPFKTNYWYFYNIRAIQVIGTDLTIGAAQNIAQNQNVLTNMNQDPGSVPATKLKDLSQLVEFTVTYNATNVGNGGLYTPVATAAPLQGDFGYIEYTNLGSSVQEFTVRIPLKIIYQWGGNWNDGDNVYTDVDSYKGAIYTTVDIKTKATQARQMK